jgi:CBS domain-containing protein
MVPPLQVRDVMATTVATVRPEASLDDAARLLRAQHISGIPVVDATGTVVGVLSEKDIVAQLHRATGVGSARGLLDLLLESSPNRGENVLEVSRHQLHNGRVHEAMHTPVVTVSEDAQLEKAARLMREAGVKRLPVLDRHGRLVGIVTRSDIVAAVSGAPRGRHGSLSPGPANGAGTPSGPFEDA